MDGSKLNKGINRRDFLKVGSLGVAAVMVPTVTGGLAWASENSMLDGKRLAMVIDLQRCVGCGACIIACKSENNIKQDVVWASRISRTVGQFPNVRYEYIPTLCNHCERAPCVDGCPTTAIHKAEGNITRDHRSMRLASSFRPPLAKADVVITSTSVRNTSTMLPRMK